MKAHSEETTCFCSYQTAGQTQSLSCAVHDDVPDDSERLGVFVHEQVLWVCQARDSTQPTIKNTDVTTCNKISLQKNKKQKKTKTLYLINKAKYKAIPLVHWYISQ